MTGVLLDTHAWAWTIFSKENLSSAAVAAITDADAVYVSPISFFEIGQKVRIGKWPEMEEFIPSLTEILHEQGGLTAPLTPEICVHASTREWDHRDPFDRILASTAQLAGLNLVSKDSVFAEISSINRIW